MTNSLCVPLFLVPLPTTVYIHVLIFIGPPQGQCPIGGYRRCRNAERDRCMLAMGRPAEALCGRVEEVTPPTYSRLVAESPSRVVCSCCGGPCCCDPCCSGLCCCCGPCCGPCCGSSCCGGPCDFSCPCPCCDTVVGGCS